ncbi:MAG: hypothetical protein ACREUA_06620, partial [Burkholderiales bacterium]
MLHAAFRMLADFVEQESPDKHIDWSHDAVYRKACASSASGSSSGFQVLYIVVNLLLQLPELLQRAFS